MHFWTNATNPWPTLFLCQPCCGGYWKLWLARIHYGYRVSCVIYGTRLGPKSMVHVNQEGVGGISGAEVADGVDECIKAVRRQIGAGTDWIKVSETLASTKTTT